MATYIVSREDHREGTFTVDVKLGHLRERFSSMVDARKWMDLMKKSGQIDTLQVYVKEVIIGLKQQIAYETMYAY